MTEVIIKDFPNYTINENGVVKNIKTGQILKHQINKGYPKVTMCRMGIAFNRFVHRVLAEHFIPNPDNHPQINHIDGIKTNNDLSNLEWCTPSHNIRHSYRMGLQVPTDAHRQSARKNGIKSRKKVLNTETGIYYDSLKDAAKSVNITDCYLSMILNKRCKHKFSFIYV